MRRNCKKICIYIFVALIVLCGILAVFTENLRLVMAGSPRTGGSGGMEGIISRDIFNVVLPTIPETDVEQGKQNFGIYDFILDPLGVAAGRDPSKKFEPGATLYFGNTEPGSTYDWSHTSDSLSVKNKSTMDVDVELDASLAGMGNIRLTNDSKFVNDKSASVYLAMKDSRTKTAAIDKYGAYFKAILKGHPEAYKTIYNFGQSKYEHVLKSDAELAAEKIKFDDYRVRLTGACNTDNSWSNLGNPAPEITVIWTVTPRPQNVAPSIGKNTYTMAKDRPVDIEVDLGSGTKAAQGIKRITYNNSSGAVSVLQPDKYTFKNGTLTINSAYISSVIAIGVLTRNYTITFNDTVETQEIITLNADNVSAPSLDQTEFTIVSGKDVLINVDLGSGSLGATGIRSITYEKATGPATLTADKYSFENGVLKINGSYITSVIEAGIKQRDYVVTFENSVGTQETITFNVDGVAPSVAQPSYTMERNKDIAVDIDLGSGYLAATGIDSITYENSSGSITVLEAGKYSFANGILTFNADYLDKVINSGVVSRDYVIHFNNVAKTNVAITLNAIDELPSIDKTEHDMTLDKAIVIPLNLGAGNFRAKGIKEITYMNSRGEQTVLSSDKYTVVDGILTFNGSYITSVITANVASRDYAVTFDDRDETTVTIKLKADGVLPSIGQVSGLMRRGQDITLDVNLGSGYLGAKGVTEITYVNSRGVQTALSNANYTILNGVLTIKGSYITTVIGANVLSRDYTVVFDNVAKTKATFTLTADDIAPSVRQSSYKMVNGKGVAVDVELGSGNLGATGIETISYTNTSGKVVSLATSNYTLENGVLTLKDSYIATVIGAGVVSRDYTIIFNDKAKTSAVVRLFIEGTNPSIAQTLYTMQRDTDIRINVNPGTGDLQATAIRSVNYKNSSGALTALTTDKYSFSNGVLTFKGGYISTVIGAGVTSRVYTVVFNNMVSTQINITLTAPNVAPSIAQTSHQMVSGKDLPINVDLGSGSLRATYIKSIIYTNSSGAASTLATSKYSFSNGVLTFYGSYITSVINAGVTSRNYTITFNDSTSKQVVVTLTK